MFFFLQINYIPGHIKLYLISIIVSLNTEKKSLSQLKATNMHIAWYIHNLSKKHGNLLSCFQLWLINRITNFNYH